MKRRIEELLLAVIFCYRIFATYRVTVTGDVGQFALSVWQFAFFSSVGVLVLVIAQWWILPFFVMAFYGTWVFSKTVESRLLRLAVYFLLVGAWVMCGIGALMLLEST